MIIVDGSELLSKAGLARLALVWKGYRTDLTTVGGSNSRKQCNWRDSKHDIWASDKKYIVAMVVEVLVNLVMSTHIYCFASRYFIQPNWPQEYCLFGIFGDETLGFCLD